MGITEKIRKRIFIFIFIPILITIPFFTDDIILRIISAVVLVIYAGFIIFLRDSNKHVDVIPLIETQPDLFPAENLPNRDRYETDAGEDFKIISTTKNIEIITSENFESAVRQGNKDIFKPPNFKENYDRIVHEELPEDVRAIFIKFTANYTAEIRS